MAVKVEALRALGEVLKVQPKAKGTKGQLTGQKETGGAKVEPPVNDAPTLAELRQSRKEAALAQQLAALPEEAFEQVR